MMRSVHAKRLLTGHPRAIGGTVYGTIVVLAVITAGAAAYRHHLWHLIAITAGTVLVLWAAHVYAHGLGESLGLGRRLTLDELASIARREFSIPLAAVLPLVALALGAAGLLREAPAVWLAFGIGVAALGFQGVRYAQLEGLSGMGAALAVATNLSLGLLIVALKVLVAH